MSESIEKPAGKLYYVEVSAMMAVVALDEKDAIETAHNHIRDEADNIEPEHASRAKYIDGDWADAYPYYSRKVAQPDTKDYKKWKTVKQLIKEDPEYQAAAAAHKALRNKIDKAAL